MSQPRLSDQSESAERRAARPACSYVCESLVRVPWCVHVKWESETRVYAVNLSFIYCFCTRETAKPEGGSEESRVTQWKNHVRKARENGARRRRPRPDIN